MDKERLIDARELAQDIEVRFNDLCNMDLFTAAGLADSLRLASHYKLQKYWMQQDNKRKHVDEPTPTCPGLHNCPKIAMVADKDLLTEQYVDAVREVCKKCREKANG